MPEFHDEAIREVIVRPCRIIYRVSEERQALEIIRVWHGARGEADLTADKWLEACKAAISFRAYD